MIKNRPSLVCGHKISPNSPPHTNCRYCWFSLFASHPGLVQVVDAVYRQNGPLAVDKEWGQKFRKHFVIFMATQEYLKRQGEEGNAKEEENSTDSEHPR